MDIPILRMVSLKSLFHLAGRQTSGLMASLFELMQVELPRPRPSFGRLRNHSTMSRRMGKLDVSLPVVETDGRVILCCDRLDWNQGLR